MTDLNDAVENNKVYAFNTGAANNPGYNYGFVQAWAEGNNIHQLAVQRGGTGSVYMSERSRGSAGTWGEWDKLPTRDEMDTVKNSLGRFHTIKSIPVNVGSSETFTAPARATCLLVTSGQASNCANIWIITSGGVEINEPLKLTNNQYPTVTHPATSSLDFTVENAHPAQSILVTLYCLQHA